MALLALGLALGVCLYSCFDEGMFALIAACPFILLALLIRRRGRFGAAVLALAVALGLLRAFLADPGPLPTGAHTLTGYIGDPVEYARNGSGAYAELYDARCDGVAIRGRVRLRLPAQSAARLAHGDRIAADANVSLPSDDTLEGFNERRYYLSQNIVLLATAQTVTLQGHRTAPIDLLIELRLCISRTIDYLFGEAAPVVRALLIDDRAGLTDADMAVFRDSGIAHVLALSGFNVSVLTGALFLLLPRSMPRLRLILVGALLLLYCAIAAFPSSLIRASVMMMALLAAPALSRRNDPITSTSSAFALIVLVSPWELYAIGFQLSFAAVYAIILLNKPVQRLFGSLPAAVTAPICVTVCGTAGTLPLIMRYFGRIALYSLFSNILLLPLISLGMVLAVIALLLNPLLPAVAHFCAAPTRLLFGAVNFIADGFASIPPGAFSVARPSIAACASFYAAMVALSPYCMIKRTKKLLLASGLILLGAALMLFA